MSHFNQQSILILGGTSGFGLSIAKTAIQLGAHLTITGRQPDKLEQAVSELKKFYVHENTQIKGLIFDAYLDESAHQLAQQLGQYNHIISTVGSFMGGGFLSASYDTIQRAINEKFNANLKIAQAFSTRITSGGSMIFTSGSGGKLYNASGALIGNQAIRMLVQGLAIELAPHIRVNSVSPTWTETPLWRKMSTTQIQELKKIQADQIPLKRTATIEEVASAYIFLMQNDFITGQNIAVDGGVDLL